MGVAWGYPETLYGYGYEQVKRLSGQSDVREAEQSWLATETFN
ncbi:MAG: hypothetical protein JWN98_312 [Abditibacteriota bacterium]|nr:hypothetical protein [Abditibacteriota bacterium]